MCVRAYVFNIHTETIHFQSRCVAATALSLHYISARTSPGVHIIIIIIIVVVAVDSFFFSVCCLSLYSAPCTIVAATVLFSGASDAQLFQHEPNVETTYAQRTDT